MNEMFARKQTKSWKFTDKNEGEDNDEAPSPLGNI